MGETQGHGREARQKVVLEALSKGNTRRAASAYAGIHHDTFYQWLKEPTFADAVLKAEADAEMEAVAVIRAAAYQSWQAAAWFLERWPRTKQDWKRTDELDLRKLTVEQLLALEAALDGGTETTGDRAALTGSDPG